MIGGAHQQEMMVAKARLVVKCVGFPYILKVESTGFANGQDTGWKEENKDDFIQKLGAKYINLQDLTFSYIFPILDIQLVFCFLSVKLVLFNNYLLNIHHVIGTVGDAK